MVRKPPVPKKPEDDQARWNKWMKGRGGLTLDIPTVRGGDRVLKGWYGSPGPGKRFFNPNEDPWKPLSKSPTQSPTYRRRWTIDDEFEVPLEEVKRLIGPQGKTLKKLSEKSGCKLILDQVRTTGFRVASVCRIGWDRIGYSRSQANSYAPDSDRCSLPTGREGPHRGQRDPTWRARCR